MLKYVLSPNLVIFVSLFRISGAKKKTKPAQLLQRFDKYFTEAKKTSDNKFTAAKVQMPPSLSLCDTTTYNFFCGTRMLTGTLNHIQDLHAC